MAEKRNIKGLIRALSYKEDILAASYTLHRTFNWSVQEHAIKALGELKDPRAVEPLIGIFTDRHTEDSVRVMVAAALGKLRDPRAVEPLTKALFYKHKPDLRNTAAWALGQIGDPRAVGPLIKSLDDQSDVCINAIEALGILGDPQAIRPLLRLQSNILNDYARPIYIKALAKFKDARTLQSLIAALDYENVRIDAIKALGDINDSLSVESLVTYTYNGDEKVRLAAVDSLANLGEPKWKELIKGNRGDFDRLIESKALYSYQDPNAIQQLFVELVDHDGGVRRGAAFMLSIFGETRWRELVEANDGDFRRLAQTNDKRLIVPLTKALDNKDAKVTALVAEALVDLKTPLAVGPLINLLCSESGAIRMVAAKALARLGETQWEHIVKGDDRDYERLGETCDQRFLSPLKILVGSVAEPAKRRQVALAFLTVLRANHGFRALDPDLANKIRMNHEDWHTDRADSSDCSYGHHDIDFGIDINEFMTKDKK